MLVPIKIRLCLLSFFDNIKTMFEINLKTKGVEQMRDALDEVQHYLKEVGDPFALYEYRIPLVPESELFKIFASMVDNGQATAFGGLIYYCHNALDFGLDSLEEDTPATPLVFHLVEKIAWVAYVLPDVAPITNISKEEIRYMNECYDMSRVWINHQKRRCLLVDVLKRVGMVKKTLRAREYCTRSQIKMIFYNPCAVGSKCIVSQSR